MGNDSSKSKGQVLSAEPPKPMPPEPPYHGPPAQYQFVNTEVVIGTQMGFAFLQSPMVTSNIDTYYPLLAAQYAEGFRLLSFYRIPGQQQQQGLFSTRVGLGFQGIFCRYPTAPRMGNWQLRIEKSVIQLQCGFSGLITIGNRSVVSDTSHILDSIARNTQGGGRLICVEMTGGQQAGNMRSAMRGMSPLVGVDLFFEVPDSPSVEQYVYSCVSVPILMTVRMGIRPVPVVQCDWIGVLGSNLNQGWRLIEIFMDKGTHTQSRGFSGQATLNSMWFFEKLASRMNDPTPVYQGTVVDHQIKLQTTFGGVRTTANWEPIIQEMGNKGWELACILETPEYQFTGLATVRMTCKLFFQRPILPQDGAMMPSQLPPPYDAAVGGGLGGGQGEGSSPAPPTGFNVPPAPEKGEMGY